LATSSATAGASRRAVFNSGSRWQSFVQSWNATP
jgi:hypothetical protein